MITITKKIDDLGRIAIPRDLRRSLQWMGGDEIEIVQNDNTIILKKHQDNFVEQLNAIKEQMVDKNLMSEGLEHLFDELSEQVELHLKD